MRTASTPRLRKARVVTAVFALFATLVSIVAVAAPTHAATVTIPNGTLFNDTSGNPMTAHGAGAIRVGNTYYLFGENRNPNDTFQSISIYKSTDLKNWQFDGDALNQSSAAELNTSNLERPKVLYNAATQKYVLYVHWEQNVADYTQARVAVATSSTINGPYAYHGSFRPLGYDSRDMTLFQDTDGTGYLVSSVNDNLDLIFMKLSADYRSIDSVVANPWPGQRREAPAIFKRNGVYFAVTSGQDGWNYTQGKYATATNIAGPWTAMQDFADNATYGSQSNYVLPVQGTSGTSYLYMGDRWAGNWGAPVDQSEYVWLPFTFPTSTTLTLPWSPFTSIDTGTGVVSNVAGGPGTTNNAFKSIVGEQSQKCLDVDGNNRNLGSTLVLFTCNSAKNQQFQVLQQADGSVNFITRHSHLCLDVQGNSTADGQAIIQYTCNGGANQRFTPELVSGEYYRLRIAASGKCVDVQGQTTTNGTRLIQYTCNNGPNQKFRFP